MLVLLSLPLEKYLTWSPQLGKLRHEGPTGPGPGATAGRCWSRGPQQALWSSGSPTNHVWRHLAPLGASVCPCPSLPGTLGFPVWSSASVSPGPGTSLRAPGSAGLRVPHCLRPSEPLCPPSVSAPRRRGPGRVCLAPSPGLPESLAVPALRAVPVCRLPGGVPALSKVSGRQEALNKYVLS